MKTILMLLALTLMVRLSFCQTLFPRLTVLGTDTVVAILPEQLKTLNGQITLLSNYKVGCDSVVSKANGMIASLKMNQIDLQSVIDNQDIIIDNKDLAIENFNAIEKKKRKMWLRRTLYVGGGGLIAGAIVGILATR